MTITDWPKEDRPREKLLKRGEHALTDAELVAIFLKTGVPGKTALDIAKELLSEYGNLKKLLRAPMQTLIQKSGLKLAKYATLKAAIELGRRYLYERIEMGEILNKSTRVQAFLNNRMREHVNEVFACLFLDTNLRLLSYEELFHGTINEAHIYPREIVRCAIEHNAAKIILAHNHPSGLPIPSMADKKVTHIIKQALALIDIQIIDHIIIGDSHNFSFAEARLL